MKKIKIYLILFFKILFYNIVYSQSCEIKIYGEVFDLHDKSPIIGALITLKGADFFSQTNFDGKYIIESKGSRAEMLKVLDHVVALQKPNS